MQLTTRILFAALIALIVAGCSKSDNAALQQELHESSMIGKKGQQGPPAPLTAADFHYDDPACVDEEHQFTLENTQGENLQVQIWDDINDEWVPFFQLNNAPNTTTTFGHTFPSAGTFELRAKIGGGGFTDGFFVTAENCGCDESFTYVDNGDNTYTFTYIPEEDMESAELVFTFAQGVSVSGLAGWSSHGVTRQNTMNLLACEEYTWTVELVANCSGNSPQSNVWTDFKVNDLSKKVDPEDKFIQSCQ